MIISMGLLIFSDISMIIIFRNIIIANIIIFIFDFFFSMCFISSSIIYAYLFSLFRWW